MTTPIRSALKARSGLREKVHAGLGALDRTHKRHIEEGIRTSFADSLDIDANLRAGNDQANRWDYLLGHTESASVVALEPHSAYTGEVSTVIAKRQAAREQLASHLKPAARISSWFWVASGKVDFLPHEKVIRRLDQEGITFVGEMLRKKHLPEGKAK